MALEHALWQLGITLWHFDMEIWLLFKTVWHLKLHFGNWDYGTLTLKMAFIQDSMALGRS